jgi:hypothetical protein
MVFSPTFPISQFIRYVYVLYRYSYTLIQIPDLVFKFFNEMNDELFLGLGIPALLDSYILSLCMQKLKARITVFESLIN